MKLMASSFGGRRWTNHSARVSGARFWSSLGVGETTIALLGDWKGLKTLRRYFGTSGVCKTLAREIWNRKRRSDHHQLQGGECSDFVVGRRYQVQANHNQPGTPRIQNLKRMKSRKRHQKTEEGTKVEDGSKAMDLEEALAVVGGRSRKWHRLRDTTGALHHWKTSCGGDSFNYQTMTLRRMSEISFSAGGTLCLACDKARKRRHIDRAST